MKTSKMYDTTDNFHYRSAFSITWSLIHYTTTNHHITLIHRL